MKEKEIYDKLLEIISSYYKAIGSSKRLKILLANSFYKITNIPYSRVIGIYFF